MKTKTMQNPFVRLAGFLTACFLGLSAVPLQSLTASADEHEAATLQVGDAVHIGDTIDFGTGVYCVFDDDNAAGSKQSISDKWTVGYNAYSEVYNQYQIKLNRGGTMSSIIWITSEDLGSPTCITVKSGDGSENNPYLFGVGFTAPERIIQAGDVFKLGAEIDFGAGTYFMIDEYLITSLKLSGKWNLQYVGYDSVAGACRFRLTSGSSAEDFWICADGSPYPKGIEVTDGDGTAGNPYVFGAVSGEPPRPIQLDEVFQKDDTIDFGTGTCCILDDLDTYGTFLSGQYTVSFGGFYNQYNQYKVTLTKEDSEEYLWITSEDLGTPAGFQVTGGDGTESNPYTFGMVFGHAGSVTLSSDGTLTLSGMVTKEQIWAYRKDIRVKHVVAADDCVLPTDCSYLFEYNKSSGDDDFDKWCGLTSIDLSKADTSNVTDMTGMFFYNSKITELDLSSFDTSNVTNMDEMFEGCTELTSLDISSFDTSKVTDMSGMFGACRKLTELDLSSFDTSNVTDMCFMFDSCEKLTELDLSSFDTSNVTNMVCMFSLCYALTTIYVSDLWNTNSVSDSEYLALNSHSGNMFYMSSKLVGGNGTVYDSSKIDKTYARIDKPGQPGYLTDANIVTYNLFIADTQVTGANAADILGNGVFSYNHAQNRLTINSDFETLGKSVVQNRIPDLTIYTASDSVLKSDSAVMVLTESTRITGPGKLTLISEENCALYQTHDCLTIENAKIDVSGVWGIAGYPKDESLKIINSSVHAVGAIGAVTDFASGITLTDCQIDPPGSLYINLYIEEGGFDEDGECMDTYRWSIDTAESDDFFNQASPATEVSIVPAKEYQMWIGGVQVSSRNRNDILGNGVFSYDPSTSTLSVSGDYQYNRNTNGAYSSQSLIESMIPDLTINVCQDSVLTAGTGVDGGIRLYGNTKLTGSGKLTMNGGHHGILLDYDVEDGYQETGCNLTIKDATVKINAMYGITTGCEFYDHYLTVDHSSLIIDASNKAVGSITGGFHTEGIILRDCQIITPYGGKVALYEYIPPEGWESDGPDVSTWYYIANPDGSAASYVEINTQAPQVTDVSLTQTEFAYTGKAVKIGSYITVKSGDKKLTYGTDFTMSYHNNVNCGVNTASVTITGTGSYTGTVTKYYTILPKKQAKPVLSTALTNDGQWCLHGEWTADSNAQGYQVQYCKNSSFTGETLHAVSYTTKTSCDLVTYPKLGEKWYVRVRSYIKDSAGTKYGIWSNAASITLTAQVTDVSLAQTEFAYTGKEVKIGSYITVKSGDKKLTYGTDFTMSYHNNVNCGVNTASVTITGTGSYTGTVTKEFTIVPKQQDKPTATAVSGGFKVSWTKDANAAGYEISYCKNSSFTGDTLHTASYTGTSAVLTKYPASGETWYVKVRAFITKDGARYGIYSTAVSVKAG